MKNVLVLLILLLFPLFETVAQRTCGSELNMEAILQNDPERYKRLMQMEQNIADFSTPSM
jgi:predicted RND superfamily exporter protein